MGCKQANDVDKFMFTDPVYKYDLGEFNCHQSLLTGFSAKSAKDWLLSQFKPVAVETCTATSVLKRGEKHQTLVQNAKVLQIQNQSLHSSLMRMSADILVVL